jgi:hypothetical protein
VAKAERNGRTYHYKSKRVNGRVVTTYVGAGNAGRLALVSDFLARRVAAKTKAKALEGIHAEKAEDVRIQSEIDDRLAVVEAHLYAAGYHKPGRWKWRRRRDGGEGPVAREAGAVGRQGGDE